MVINYYIELKSKHNEFAYNDGFFTCELASNKKVAIERAKTIAKAKGRPTRVKTWRGEIIYKVN